MRRARTVLPPLLAVVLGFATMAAIAGQWLHPGIVAGAFAVLLLLVLPWHPRLVAAACGGAALAVALVLVSFLNPGWDSCADEVDGRLVEFECSEGPPGR